MYDKWDQSYLSVQGQSDAHDATYMQQYTYRLFHRHQHATVWDHTRILNISLSATSSNLSGPPLVTFNFRRLISVTYVFSSFFCVSGCNLYHMSWIWPWWSFEKMNEAWKKNGRLSSTDSSLREIVIGPVFLSTMTEWEFGQSHLSFVNEEFSCPWCLYVFCPSSEFWLAHCW